MNILKNFAKSPLPKKKLNNAPAYGLGVTCLHGSIDLRIIEASDLPDMEGLLGLKVQLFTHFYFWILIDFFEYLIFCDYNFGPLFKMRRFSPISNSDLVSGWVSKLYDKKDVTDPYVDVHLGKARLVRTSVIVNDLNPKWNEDYRWILLLRSKRARKTFLLLKKSSGVHEFFRSYRIK